MRWGVAIGFAVLLVLQAGCGDLGASEDELTHARRRGERLALEKANARADDRVQEARSNAYWQGILDGYKEAEEEGAGSVDLEDELDEARTELAETQDVAAESEAFIEELESTISCLEAYEDFC